MLRRHLCIVSSLLVLFLSVTASLHATKKPPLQPINLNTATASQLQEVPGIGPATADKILRMRKAYGAFKSVDDLRAIKGIGPKRLEKMRRYLTVGKTSPSKTGASLAKPATPENVPEKSADKP